MSMMQYTQKHAVQLSDDILYANSTIYISTKEIVQLITDVVTGCAQSELPAAIPEEEQQLIRRASQTMADALIYAFNTYDRGLKQQAVNITAIDN